MRKQYRNSPQQKVPVRLLIVDDETPVRSALTRSLTLLGYSTEEAASGRQALDLLAREAYDLMILDMHMPGMDGLEVMKQAHRLYPKLLIIVLTGYASLDSAIAAVKLEAADYLLKPVKLEEIIEAVGSALQKRAQQPEPSPESELNPAPLDVSSTLAIHSRQLICVPPVTFDRQNRLVKLDNKPDYIELTEGEAIILANLMAQPNQVISCGELVDLAWNYNLDETEAEKLIRPYIFRLRRKLETDSKRPLLIRTVRRRGYLFTSIRDKFPDKSSSKSLSEKNRQSSQPKKYPLSLRVM